MYAPSDFEKQAVDAARQLGHPVTAVMLWKSRLARFGRLDIVDPARRRADDEKRPPYTRERLVEMAKKLEKTLDDVMVFTLVDEGSLHIVDECASWTAHAEQVPAASTLDSNDDDDDVVEIAPPPKRPKPVVTLQSIQDELLFASEPAAAAVVVKTEPKAWPAQRRQDEAATSTDAAAPILPPIALALVPSTLTAAAAADHDRCASPSALSASDTPQRALENETEIQAADAAVALCEIAATESPLVLATSVAVTQTDAPMVDAQRHVATVAEKRSGYQLVIQNIQRAAREALGKRGGVVYTLVECPENLLGGFVALHACLLPHPVLADAMAQRRFHSPVSDAATRPIKANGADDDDDDDVDEKDAVAAPVYTEDARDAAVVIAAIIDQLQGVQHTDALALPHTRGMKIARAERVAFLKQAHFALTTRLETPQLEALELSDMALFERAAAELLPEFTFNVAVAEDDGRYWTLRRAGAAWPTTLDAANHPVALDFSKPVLLWNMQRSARRTFSYFDILLPKSDALRLRGWSSRNVASTPESSFRSRRSPALLTVPLRNVAPLVSDFGSALAASSSSDVQSSAQSPQTSPAAVETQCSWSSWPGSANAASLCESKEEERS